MFSRRGNIIINMCIVQLRIMYIKVINFFLFEMKNTKHFKVFRWSCHLIYSPRVNIVKVFLQQ